MPWTAGGTPVTIERLLGLVKLGTTQSHALAAAGERGGEPGHGARRHRLLGVVGLAAVDADHDHGLLGPDVAPAVDAERFLHLGLLRRWQRGRRTHARTRSRRIPGEYAESP